MTTKVVKGSLWTLAGQVAPLAVSLFATPFVIRMLGTDGYGVLILVALIPTYLGFADFGMAMASTKFGSQVYGQGLSPEKEGAVIRTAAFIAFLTSVPFGFAIFIVSDWIVGIFNVPDHLHAEAGLALKIAAVTFIVNFLNNIFNAPQLARLRMDLNTLVTSGFRILGIIATPIVLYLDGGIFGAVLVLMIASLLTLAGHIFISGKLLPSMFGVTIDMQSVRPMLKFGGAFAMSGIAAALFVNAEKLILTRVTSVETLAYYSVAFTFANMATMFSLAMGQSLLPAFSQLFLPEKKEQLNGLFSRAMRINIFALLPVLAVLCVIGRPFFTIWAGEDFGRESTWPFYVLVIGLFFNLSAYVPTALMYAAGRTELIAKMYWIQLLPYLGVTTLLTIQLGAVGAAIAWSLRVIIDVFIYIHLVRSIVGVRFAVVKQLPNLLVGLLILSPAIGFAVFRNECLIWHAVVMVFCLALYGLTLWKTLIDADEKIWISTRLNNFWRLHYPNRFQ
nr:flippase [Pyrinomonadaceae bacterium]